MMDRTIFFLVAVSVYGSGAKVIHQENDSSLFVERSALEDRADYSCSTNAWDKEQYCLCQPGYKVQKMYSVHDNGREDRRYTLNCEKISPNYPVHSSYPSITSQTNWDAKIEFNFKSSYSGFMVGMRSYHDNGREDRRFKFYYTKIDTKYWELNSCGSWKKMNDWDKKMDFKLTGNQVFAGIKSTHDNGREDRKWYAYTCNLVRKPTPAKGCVGKCCWENPSSSSNGNKISGVAWPINNVPSVEACAQHCKEESRCNGFHYYGPYDNYYGDCYIKQSVTGITTSLDDGRDRYGGICAEDCEWNNWNIGTCSKTCGGGTRTNTRTKKTVEKNGGTCEGQSTMQEACNTQQCPPIHCEWNQWTIGECSEECGTGTRTNTRTKKVVEEHGGTCTGQPTETETCKLKECPVHCEWNDWNIGTCSKPCGGGERTNTRDKKVSAEHGGDECEGVSTITESCNSQECPVDCKWNDWVPGPCSTTCGDGVLTKTRTKVEAQFGGQPCTGDSSMEEQCPFVNCPVPCQWGPWELGECSATCGGGSRVDTRITIQEAMYGAPQCDPVGYQKTEPCNTHVCPPIHCEWNDWVIGECSQECGTGTRTNTRTKKVVEKDGGTCTGQDTEIKECKIKECPVHCEWGPWSVTDCDKSCGGGMQTETRTIATEAKHEGNECTGGSTITKSCNVQECPVDCEWGDWIIGDCSAECAGGLRLNYRMKTTEEAFGGTCDGEPTAEESCNTHECPEPCLWSDWNLGECSVTCGGGTQIDTREVLREASVSMAQCYDDPVGPVRTVDCNPEACPIIHCVWDEWIIGECSTSCGTGTRTNNRTKLITENDFGTCTGQPTETEVCKLMECPVHCEWNEWTIGECSLTCGGGERINTRTTNQTAEHGGDECEGPAVLTESCNVGQCPVDCKWSDWMDGECSEPCGDGTQIMTRTIVEENDFGGLPCEGDSTLEAACFIEDCPPALSDCPEEKSSYCWVYAYYYPSQCEDTPQNDWFLGADGRYACRKSCGLC